MSLFHRRTTAFLVWVATAFLAGAAGSLLVNGISVARADEPPPVTRCLRAKSFELVNDKGEVMGWFQLGGDGGAQFVVSATPLANVQGNGMEMMRARGDGPSLRVSADAEKKTCSIEIDDTHAQPVWVEPH